jgi:hypothetical protein
MVQATAAPAVESTLAGVGVAVCDFVALGVPAVCHISLLLASLLLPQQMCKFGHVLKLAD